MAERGRVIAGTARGTRLEAPPAGTRPLADRVKQSLFAALEAAGALDGPFLDLYAGSGAAGIEALSRGAPRAMLVERDARAAAVIEANLERAHLTGEVVRADVLRLLASGRAPDEAAFTAALIDPPYDEPLVAPTLELLGSTDLGWIAPGGTVVAKHFWRNELAPRAGTLRRERQKRFGETVLTFYTREA